MTKEYQAVWRKSGIETRGFPKLMVDDNVVSGSINVRGTRLPLWAIINTAICEGWGAVERGWSPGKRYNYTGEDLAHFLYCLLEQRGEFGRLLLLLAQVERIRDPWWENASARHRVMGELQNCIDVLMQIENDIKLGEKE